MKISSYILSILLGSMLMFSCSENIPKNEKIDKHEQLFNSTVDSLKVYEKTAIIQEEFADNEEFKDFLRLDFNEYKEKYKLKNSDMDELAKAMQTTISIAQTFKSIEENQLKIEKLPRLEYQKNPDTDYSFNKEKQKAYNYDQDTSIEIQVMMAQ